jgi:glycosyltransferase involved in cell wall biosynthesis
LLEKAMKLPNVLLKGVSRRIPGAEACSNYTYPGQHAADEILGVKTLDTGNKNQNIWIFNQYAVTPDQPGGTRHYAVSRILAGRGYRVTLFASGFNYQNRKELKCTGREDFKIELCDGVRFVWIRTVPYKKNNWKRVVNMLSYSWRCLRVYKKLLRTDQVEKPGTIIGSAVHLFAVWTAYRVSKKLKANFVMETRDLWPMTLVEFRKELKYHPIVVFFRILDRFLAKRAQRIISVLPGAYDYYKKYGIAKEKVVWIPNGVDANLFGSECPTPSDTVQQKRFKVMYTGTLGMEACLRTLLSAAKSIRENRLPIAFEIIGSGEKQKELVKFKNQLGLQNVVFREPVKKEKIPSELASADALWIGSRKVENLYKYGFSFNKLFEYLAAGKPILFSIDAAYNPVKEAGAGLTVPPEDPEALSKAIIQLYEMPVEERIKMGQKGIAYAKEFHDFEKLADRFDRLLVFLASARQGVKKEAEKIGKRDE